MGANLMTLEEAIDIAKNYFLDKEVPKTTREWRSNCPPELTAGKINSLSFTVGDVLRGVNPKARARKSRKVEYDLTKLGFADLVFSGSKGKYTCSNCGHIRQSERSTILNWLNTGVKFCSYCRSSSGTEKGLGHYTDKLPDGFEALEVLREAGNTKIVVKHLDCGNSRTYSSRHVLSSEQLYCSHCDSKEGYASMKEKELCEHISSEYPQLGVQFQVKYSQLANTNRRWVLDVFIEELNLALEITTKGNGYEGYFENLENKLDFLRSAGYIAKVVYSTEEVDDIVRSLVKAKEA